jgi:REP element-mobilizing transposase RayT
MPRANKHYMPGYVWHITHRCHKKEFLLKFARDRRRYLQRLFEAKKRLARKGSCGTASGLRVLRPAPLNLGATFNWGGE